jgi:aminoglycoside phosphotransferase (APT) family kinase protein
VLTWVERHAGDRVRSIRRLPGASTSAVHRLGLESGVSVVLRRYVWPLVLENEPLFPQREVDALVFGASKGLALPELIAADLSGAEAGDGTPTLLMSFLPGRAVSSPDVHALAIVAATIHAVDPSGFPHQYFDWFGGADRRPPTNARRVNLWDRAIQVVSAGPPPFRPVFVHRDFHPGNVLWRRGRCSGVVDWANACAGPSGCDLGHCRANLLGLAGREAADTFRSAYETLTGEAYHPYWELASVFDHGPSPWSDDEIIESELRLAWALGELGRGSGRPIASGVGTPDRHGDDRPLSEGLVRSLLDDQFPTLSAREVRLVGSGWDNDVYLVDGTWAFRFPRRAEVVPWVQREKVVMAAVSEKLGPLVPHFQWLGEPSHRFPYPFVGYRWLAGVGADQTERTDRSGLARDLGEAFSRLHEIDIGLLPPSPAGWEDEPWSNHGSELAAVAHDVRPLLSDALRHEAEPYLAGSLPPPPRRGPQRFVHNDVCPDHVLVDPGTGRLAGLIDCADAMAGDPVLDFVGLIGIGDRSFVGEVVGHYRLPLGEEFEATLDWLTRVLTLRWLADAVVDDPSQIRKNLTWVERAFQSTQVIGPAPRT